MRKVNKGVIFTKLCHTSLVEECKRNYHTWSTSAHNVSIFLNILKHGLTLAFSPGNVNSLPKWVVRSLFSEISSAVTTGTVEWLSRSVSIADTGPTVESSTLFTLKILPE